MSEWSVKRIVSWISGIVSLLLLIAIIVLAIYANSFSTPAPNKILRINDAQNGLLMITTEKILHVPTKSVTVWGVSPPEYNGVYEFINFVEVSYEASGTTRSFKKFDQFYVAKPPNMSLLPPYQSGGQLGLYQGRSVEEQAEYEKNNEIPQNINLAIYILIAILFLSISLWLSTSIGKENKQSCSPPSHSIQ